MNNFEVCVISWDVEKANRYLDHISKLCDCTGFVISRYDHETVLLNQAIAKCRSDYLWFLTPDVEVMFPQTPHLMVEFMKRNANVGAMIPNREGERFIGGPSPYKKYLEDGTALMYRTAVGATYDLDFVFTGYSDLDFGKKIEYLDYEVWVDPRTCVKKQFTPYGSWSAFRSAYNARNRLLLEAKWYWIGYGQWLDLDYFNEKNPEQRIPTQFELAWWDEQRLMRFATSVNMEHPEILLKDGQGTGNEDYRFAF